MLRIGDFSKISQVSVKTLRYYDEIGLLKPAEVDDVTGYRYYTPTQLPRLNRILVFKDLGLSLEQIAQLLRDDLPLAQIQGMLRLKQAELDQQIHEEQARLRRIAARLRQIEQEGCMSNYEIVIKQIEPQRVASVRDTLPAYGAISGLINELYAYLGPRGVGGPCGAIWHDPGYKEQDIDGEAIVLIDRPVPGEERVKVYELPGGALACTIHRGCAETFSQAYSALLNWVEANGYRIVGPNREIYLQSPAEGDLDTEMVTEIQFPVEKI